MRPKYLEGKIFTVRTHTTLRWILNMGDEYGKLARWMLRLQDFEFDRVHKTVIKHQAAEAR